MAAGPRSSPPPTYSTSCAEGEAFSDQPLRGSAERRVVSTRTAASAQGAALDYVRCIGCSRDEVTYLGTDAVARRGAIYRAAEVRPVPPDNPVV